MAKCAIPNRIATSNDDPLLFTSAFLMHTDTLHRLHHHHSFSADHHQGERRTWQVLILTAIVMVAEITAGTVYGSMALLADGWHMGTHLAAFLITLFAYRYATKHQNNPEFSFGTGKVGVLGGFASAVALFVVALLIAVEAVERLAHPREIQFGEAITVAIIGLCINLICAAMLHGDGSHDHHAGHHHAHDAQEDEAEDAHHHDHAPAAASHGGHDHNLRAAYLHVLADALTSVLAIVALLLVYWYGWNWVDPLIGLVGALVISRWAIGLVRETSPILLDQHTTGGLRQQIRTHIEADADNRISDLHLWYLGPGSAAAIISLVTHHPQPIEHYKRLLHDIPELAHITVEVHRCSGDACPATATAVPS